MQRRADRQAGFTFLELLVVGAIIIGFVATMLLLIRPNNRDVERRNATRLVDLAITMRAITEYEKKHDSLPPSIGIEARPIATSEDETPSLCDDLVPEFLNDLRFDPQISLRVDTTGKCSEPDQYFITGYTAQVIGGRVILRAPAAEKGETISIERWFPLF